MNYYQLKVTLNGTKPPIYRRILIIPEIKLPKFHYIIQIIMGWTDSHLHQFIIDGQFYGEPHPDDWTEVINYNNIKIKDVLVYPKDKIKYEYDFGDGWEHVITLEKIIESKEEFNIKCIKGERCCPPEDCGGVGGYYNLLEIINDPRDEEYESMIEWLGDEYDPEYFNIEEINNELEYFNKKKKK